MAKARKAAKKTNKTWATEVLREDHERIKDLFADFDNPAEEDQRGEIVEQILVEIRVHRALVEEVLLPAVREASGDPGALSDVQEDLETWEALLSAVERHPVTDPEFAGAWRALETKMQAHLKKDHRGLLNLAQTLPLNFVNMGLRMEELRRQIMAERPVPSQDTSN